MPLVVDFGAGKLVIARFGKLEDAARREEEREETTSEF
jgi:hypothetical protein